MVHLSKCGYAFKYFKYLRGVLRAFCSKRLCFQVASLPNKDTPVYTYCTGGIRCVKVPSRIVQFVKYDLHELLGDSSYTLCYCRSGPTSDRSTG